MNPEMEELFAEHVDSDFDVFDAEYDQFREDVEGLILGALKVALGPLHALAEAELKELNQKNARDGGRAYDLDENVAVAQHYENQERFLRNMALVALASRLTHALRKMAKNAWFRKGKKKYGTGAHSEFQRLWIEYGERFGFQFEPDQIAFTDTMRVVRNQIVHDGGEANPFKEVTFEAYNQGEEGYLDLSFSKAYPTFVRGSGMFAEVEVNEKQLEEMIERSFGLVRGLAVELRKIELAYIEEMNKQLKERKKG